ncbi:MAG: UDP-N-acetylglucosamine--N-acetylmuramyl-(pentapeptide) pyrophosphoryl-undecaprenol N-acetylglucosamine transferase [Clostridia bacterium]|nr:UDP-N-acetylglucosamine--N-acetylmuramyl-(pentapeptide) pyrophosphoryl-undecaprenol N-acetylglucosamine transferase [Clostridia bacterium]
MKKILFTGGGSAGHVIPNIALINDLRAKGSADVCYMGSGGIEKSIVTAQKIPYFEITCPKLVRGFTFRALKNNLRIPFAFRRAVKEAEKGLKTFQPNAVFSKGGYVALPVVFAARKLGIPCFAHESDFSIGLANKLSAKKCECVFTSFPETATALKNGVYSGAPLKRELFGVSSLQAKRKFGVPQEMKTVLVFGGGSGSEAINAALRSQLSSLTRRYFILHVCGKGNVIHTTYKNYRQEEFITDMGGAYACADLIVSRAGAGAVFEILALKKPAILIPLENASRGDQKENAAYFEKQGLCRVLPQPKLSQLDGEIASAFLDSKLQNTLKESNFRMGNDVIIRRLLQALKK